MPSIQELQKRIVRLAHEHWGSETGGAYRMIIESLAYAIAVILLEQKK